MAIKRRQWQAGTVVVLEHVSKVLQGNPLGDPHVRNLAVWLPPQYDDGVKAGRGKRFPMLMDLAGFTGSGLAHIGWKNFSENIPERAARLVHERKMAPAIIVFPDCFTALGGNQYINSSAIGSYADYLLKEIIPFVDREFRTLATRESRACFGKSSGGYGAMIHGMKYASTWGAIANHSGDAYFDYVYWHDWPNTLNELAKHRARPLHTGRVEVRKLERDADRGLDDGRVQRFLEKISKKVKLSGAEVHALMNLCMAASYDPDPRAPNGFRLPFNLDTGEVIPARWQAWQRHDPINLVARYRSNLRSLRGIYMDCGWRDQYHIHYGTRILSKRLQAAGIPHRYEEFDDTHSDIDYRLDHSLPFLTRALQLR
ncbi:MAG: alpha/beta hydrolase-fold protein [Steroidobacteraceae bacterium]